MPVNFPPRENNDEVVREKDLRDLIKRNLELTEEILRLSQKTDSRLFWQGVFSYLKLLIIIIPLALSIIYLPPLIEKLISQYQEILGVSESAKSLNLDNLGTLPVELLKNIGN